MHLDEGNGLQELAIYNKAINPNLRQASQTENKEIITEHIVGGGDNTEHMVVLASR